MDPLGSVLILDLQLLNAAASMFVLCILSVVSHNFTVKSEEWFSTTGFSVRSLQEAKEQSR